MIRAKLYDGSLMQFDDGTPDAQIDMAVQRYIAAMRTPEVLRELAAIRRAVETSADRIVDATTAPRETVLQKDFMDKPVKSVTTTIKAVANG